MKSVLFISLHKCATSYFSTNILPFVTGLKHVDYDQQHYSSQDVNVTIEDYDHVYGVLRILDHDHPTYNVTKVIFTHGTLAGRNCIFMIRDPRDLIVSMYYSFGFTHTLSPHEGIKQYQIARREKIQSITLDEYALHIAGQLNNKFDIIRNLLQNQDTSILLKYEDMIHNFPAFFTSLSTFMTINDSIKNQLFTATRPNEKEIPTNHKRYGITGGYKFKLQRSTIVMLNEVFKNNFEFFKYEIP